MRCCSCKNWQPMHSLVACWLKAQCFFGVSRSPADADLKGHVSLQEKKKTYGKRVLASKGTVWSRAHGESGDNDLGADERTHSAALTPDRDRIRFSRSSFQTTAAIHPARGRCGHWERSANTASASNTGISANRASASIAARSRIQSPCLCWTLSWMSTEEGCDLSFCTLRPSRTTSWTSQCR